MKIIVLRDFVLKGNPKMVHCVKEIWFSFLSVYCGRKEKFREEKNDVIGSKDESFYHQIIETCTTLGIFFR